MLIPLKRRWIRPKLTPSEALVLALMSSGFAHKETAHIMGTSVAFAKMRLNRAHIKTGCSGRIHLAKWWNNLSIAEACLLLGGFENAHKSCVSRDDLKRCWDRLGVSWNVH